jgi:hypothetical protein
MSSGLMQLAAPVLANGTAAGTQITNTATASYEDPTEPTKPLNTFSNTVKVEVAEVAGITVVADTFKVVNGAGAPTNAGAVAGDKVYFDYTVTNVGNDPTKLRIPGTATSTGASSVDKVQYSLDNGVTWTDIDPAGDFTSTSKAPGETIKVRVVTTILSGAAANSLVTVSLGNTGTPGDQNTDRAANTSGGDVYTVDGSPTTDDVGTNKEVAGAPSNGVREASAFQTITIGATPQAFATVTKVRDTTTSGNIVNGVDNKGTPSLTDDTLSYDLAVKVADQADVPVNSNKIAADLTGTPINLDNIPGTVRVLVSDAVPEYTTAKTLVAPSGWVAVYTESALTVNANDALWITVPGSGVIPSAAKRVGFVSTTKVDKGTTTPVMKVTVQLTTIPATGGTVANIAQVFGSTGVTVGTVTTPDQTKPVYDESGDNKPNNYNDNGTPNPFDPTTGVGITNGVVNPATPGVTDGNNNNTGTGDGGEPNVLAIVPASQLGILNGTNGHAEAVGPTGNNDDFTNVSVPIPASTWTLDPVTDKYTPSPINPAAVPFSNTLETTTNGSVELLPTTPAATATPLPAGTKVTITQGSVSKTFEFIGGIFVNAGTTTPATPLVVPNVVAGTKVNYGVEVDLPAGTEQLKGYGVPITATSGTASNTTIDRVYTGYLKLTKEAQITKADGTIIAAFGSGDPATGVLATKALPGQLIQYRVTYTNISDVAPVNSNSVALSAQNIRVTEDGTATPNNWATNSTHKSGSATDTNGGAITYDAGKSNTSPDVNVYTDLVAPTGSAPLAPQQGGSFSFTRIIK